MARSSLWRGAFAGMLAPRFWLSLSGCCLLLLLSACASGPAPAATSQATSTPVIMPSPTMDTTGTLLSNPLLTYTGHSYLGVIDVAWSPDGKRIASAGDDHTVQVWNAATGHHLLTYKGHTSYVYTLAWSPDGKCVASSSQDTSVQVWRAV